MDEHVLAAVVGLNKSEALGRIEPLTVPVATSLSDYRPVRDPKLVAAKRKENPPDWPTGPFLGLAGFGERSALSFRCCNLAVARSE
ncbi:MAG: hypothetical protein QOJ42_7432 [Acidobacteriaceae bacterium]|jgi:hypothetical protein|nr:hypothetical protein [Acidobacteriaceae bacterium]